MITRALRADALVENCVELREDGILLLEHFRRNRPKLFRHLRVALPDEFQPAARQRDISVIQALAVEIVEWLRAKIRIGIILREYLDVVPQLACQSSPRRRDMGRSIPSRAAAAAPARSSNRRY